MARFNATGFHELEEELEDLAEDFEEAAEAERGNFTYQNPRDQNKFVSVKDAIAAGVDEAMDNIVSDARLRAENYVPEEDARQIFHRTMDWRGDEYSHRYFSTSDLVKYHEFGTGLDGPSGRRYIIEPDDEEALSFYWEKAGRVVTFEYVMHPGVQGKHFMEKALDVGEHAIKRETASRLNRLDVTDL